MSKFSLAPYTFRIKHKNSDSYLKFDNVNGLDFLDITYDYLDKVLPNFSIDIKNGEVIKVTTLNKVNRSITGKFEAGENGYGSKLLDPLTDTISYERKPLEAELIPYYFIIKLPSKYDKGIFIFQRFKNLGVKELFIESFFQYVRNRITDDYVLELNPLVPKDLIKSYVDGRVVKLRLIKQGFPRDIFDVDSNCNTEDEVFDGRCELVLAAPKNGILPDIIRSKLSRNIDKFLNSDESSIGSIIEVKNFDFDNIKIQVKVGTSYRTVDFSDTTRLRYYEDISGIDVDTNGHPKFDIIDVRAKAFLKDLALSIWGGDTDV